MSYTVFINGRQQSAPAGALLSDVLAAAGFPRPLDCGGTGACGSCAVLVDGRSVLSCQYRVYSDITVHHRDVSGGSISTGGQMCGKNNGSESVDSAKKSASKCAQTVPSASKLQLKSSKKPEIIILDLGTTTLAYKLLDASGKTKKSGVILNPQRRFGLDVMSRISYCSSHGVEECRSVLVNEIAGLINSFPAAKRRLIIAGNTAMLHILCAEDVSGLGIFPYTPKFLDKREYVVPELESLGIEKAELLPCISAYVGADAVAGLIAVSGQESDRRSSGILLQTVSHSEGMSAAVFKDAEAAVSGTPNTGAVKSSELTANSGVSAASSTRWNILCDLGTNAEILLWSSDKIFAASAAAGPCFEGAGISCGMPALPGAICGFAFGGRRSTAGSAFVDDSHRTGVFENGSGTYVSEARRLITTVSAAEPLGICGTGLFDIVASLLDCGLCSRDGEMSGGDFEVYSNMGHKIVFTQKDMRQFQLAKAAVAACIDLLMSRAGIGCSDIENLYISGGFSSRLNLKSAARTGLFPTELCGKALSVRNSCLDGLLALTLSPVDPIPDLSAAVTVDPSLEPDFQTVFLKHLSF